MIYTVLAAALVLSWSIFACYALCPLRMLKKMAKK